ncbi:NACHT domain-containing NTPase [Streptomyces sp. SM12]|uniref:NACHT domain-containing protein n=1 Tax=Streptomyces sp. SM12 TaxID=1071602 RepID=UPI000CD4AEDC|nr:NACHT domain-containing protein [Streptomyces sp. SM12]
MPTSKQSVNASRTGEASATGGGLANSGVMHIGTVIVRAADWEEAEVTPEAAAAAIGAYARRVREAYGRLDLDVLMPHSDQGDYPAVELREVFVPPGVRADPPATPLPRELLERLRERGELPREDELPPGVDPEQVARVHGTSQPPVEEALTVLAEPGRQRTVVLGDPGSGKSTLARYVALALAGGADLGAELAGRLPLVVELRRYAEARWRERTFEDFLDHLHAIEGMSVPPPVLRSLLTRGRALVVFDGLDELFDPAIREDTARRIAGFASRHPDVRVIVTSRVLGYRKAVLGGAGFGHYQLQDLTQPQIEQFTRQWYATSCPGDPGAAELLAQRLTEAVGHSRPVRELAGNPLLLTILAIIGRRQTLPRDRQGVYEHAVTVLVARWDQDAKHLRPGCTEGVREVLDVLEPADRLELLRLLARRMQEGEGGIAGNHIHTRELEEVFRTHLGQYELPPLQVRAAAQVMVRQLRERNFILSHYGSGVHGFVHRTFLEYLAAADIVQRYQQEREWTPPELLTEVYENRAGDPTWHEVLLLVTGQLAPKDAALVVDRFLDLYRSTRNPSMLALAIRALGSFVWISRSLVLVCR